MKKLLAVILTAFTLFANAQAPRTQVYFGDDTWVNVPLQFAFPMYGRVFTNSFMFSNGVVGLYSVGQTPVTSYCCSGQPVNQSMGGMFNYTIMPMQTDLLPVQGSTFFIEGDTTYQKYIWNNIAEYSNRNNLNSFSVELRPTGYIGINYQQVNIQNQYVTSAVIGDASQGEYTLNYHGLGMNSSSVPSLIEYGNTMGICTSNPLASPNCPGYAEAYHNQQCSENPLYAVTCPGYAQAYFNQQCTANPLYNSACPGYAQAYFSQQCSLNPLYDTGCPGYAQAYFNQQCSLSPLYNSGCPGYAQAYFNQQCSLSPLYDSRCPGYAQAYYNQQCSLNPLYNSGCPGYAQAYFNQQCNANQLYSQQCPGYSVAYAKKTLLEQQNTPTPVQQQQRQEQVNPTEPVAVASNQPVAQPVETTSVTSATSVSPAAVTSTVRPPPPPMAPTSVTTLAQQPLGPPPAPAPAAQQQKQEQAKAEEKVASTIERKMETKSDTKSETKQNREKMKEAVAKVQKEIAKSAQEAKTPEAQIAAQGLVVGSMNYVPGFDTYKNAVLPDTNALVMARQYEKPVVDNQRVQRRLSSSSEAKWQSIVESQYQLGR